MAGFLLHLSPFVEYFASTDLWMKQEKKMHIYTKWINSKLEKTHPPIKNLYEDLKDGRFIFSLLNVLLNKKNNTEKPEKNSSNYENVEDVLTVLKKRGLEIDIIESGENAKMNEREILALIWQIILHFQIETVLPDELLTTLEDEDSSLRTKHLLDEVEERLLKWIQDVLQGMYVVDDLESNWEDGFAFLFLLSAFRPSAVEMSKALKMSSRERLKYSFDVAEQEFGVPSLLDPSDVEKDEVDKERMLMYFSSLYEVLKNHEVKKPLLMPEIYYTIVYSMKRVQEMMDKVTDKSTGQVRTKELSEIQMELLELRKMIHQFNNRYNDIFRFQSSDHEEFSQVMKEFGELSKRWSALIKPNNKDSRRIINSAHLTIGDKVIEIESVSSNGIILKYKILYCEIITIIEKIESNIRLSQKDKQSQQTAALIGEIIQMMDQVEEIKIKQLKHLRSEVNMAENVDSKELDELNKEFEDFESRLTRIKDFLSNTNDEGVNSVEILPMETDGPIPKMTPISTNDIVLGYKTSCPKILSAVERLEERIEKIQAETPSQQNAKELKVIQKEMQSISCEMQAEISESAEVDPKEISNQSKQLIERWFILVKNYNKEIMRQPVVVREIRTRQTSHSAQLTIGDKVIDIECVSSNGIVIKYKILYHEIITIIKMIENNIKIIQKAEPSQRTAALLDENIQRLHSLQKKISELNQLMIEVKVAENVDVKELEQLQIEHKDLMTHLTYVNAFISKENEKQPVLITKTVYDIRREEAIVRSLHTRVKIILT